MTLQDIKLLNAFNAWASNRIFDAVGTMPVEAVMRDMKSSHVSIHGTLLHLVAAERTWLGRWTGTKDVPQLTAAEAPTPADITRLWEKTGYDMARFLGAMTDRKLQESFTMTTSTGQTFTHAYGQAIQHVVDHSSYHRGQVITLMRQQGHTPPTTGMIAFFRETSKLK